MKERYALRVVKGGFRPADPTTAEKLRGRVKMGELVFVEFRKPRNPGYYRLAHSFARLVTENIDEFEGMDYHRCLKRLQLESGVGCDETAIRMPGLGMVLHRTPKSLSFESLDQEQFEIVFRGLCRHVAKQYWHGLDEDQIAQMAAAMPGE